MALQGWPELRPLYLLAQKQMHRRRVLLQLVLAQIPPHVCHPEPAGSRLRHRTLQLWLGHNDLASTMVYLKAVRNKDVAARVNGSELAAFARPITAAQIQPAR